MSPTVSGLDPTPQLLNTLIKEKPMQRLSKTLVALVAGMALLALSAAPSAAATNSWTITGGTISVNLVPTLTQPLGTTGGAGCGTTITTEWSSTTSWTSGHGVLTLVNPFTYLGANYVVVLRYSSLHVNSTHITTGANTSKWSIVASNSTGTGLIITDANIYATSASSACTHSTSTPLCANIDMNFDQHRAHAFAAAAVKALDGGADAAAAHAAGLAAAGIS